MCTVRQFGIAAVVVIVLISCSGGQSSTSPPTASDLHANVLPRGSDRSCWGIWDVIIEPSSSSVEIVSIRGASFQANVVNFLQPPSAPIHLLRIDIDPDETNFPAGKVACDVTIEHPFPGTKFCGFDVLGIIMGDHDGFAFESDPDIITSFSPNTLLQNPDGWTRWWNQVEFTTYGTLFGYIEGAQANHNWTSTHTLNAFKYFCDELDPYDAFNPSPEGRGFFSSVEPGMNTRRYDLQFPIDGTPVFRFKYAISASWVAPYDTAEPPYTPDDFPLEANMPEAYKVSFFDVGSTAYYESESSCGGDLNLFIDVYDWQFDGDLSTIGEEILSVTIESPTLFPDPIELDLSEAMVNPGNPTSVRIPAFIEDVTPAGLENQLLLVTVESANVTSYEPQIPGISGYDYPDGALAAYGIYEAPIIGEVTESGWPMYRKNFARTGRTSVVGPSTPRVKFEWGVPHAINKRIISGIAIDSRQRAVFRAYTGYVYCVEPNGELAWSYETGGVSCHSTPSVGPDDNVYVGSDPSELWHIDSNGGLIWHRSYGYGIPAGGTALQGDGSVLFTTWGGYLVKVDSMGNELWAFSTPMICGGPTIGDDGTIYIASHGDRVYAIDQEGNEIWMTDCGDGDMGGAPALGPHGIYIGSYTGNFYCLDYDGNIKWWNHLGGSNYGVRHVAAIGEDGNVYVGSWNGYVYCMDQVSGDMKWSFETSDEIGSSGPVLDGAGHVYIGNYNGDFYCLSTNGDLVWQYHTDDQIHCLSPAIADDGTVLVGNDAGVLFAFKDE